MKITVNESAKAFPYSWKELLNVEVGVYEPSCNKDARILVVANKTGYPCEKLLVLGSKFEVAHSDDWSNQMYRKVGNLDQCSLSLP